MTIVVEKPGYVLEVSDDGLRATLRPGGGEAWLTLRPHVKETADMAGWKRYPFRVIAPLIGMYLRRQSAYRNAPGRYADPWGAIRGKWGEPGPDRVA